MAENKEKKLAVNKSGLREYRKLQFKKFMKNKLAVVGAGILLILLIGAIVLPLVMHLDPYEMNPAGKLQAPDASHWFGTDTLGRDVFARCTYGIKMSFVIGIITSAIAMVLGMILGLLAGYFKFLDNIIMRICESMMAIPSMLMALALMAAFGTSMKNVVIALAIVYTPMVARIARSSVISVKRQTYIDAIKAQGAGWTRILFKHIMPNSLSPVIVQTTYTFASVIIIEASLSYLGVGVPSVVPTLGNIINDAKQFMLIRPSLTILPCIVMVLLVLGVNMFGDGIRDVLDPTAN